MPGAKNSSAAESEATWRRSVRCGLNGGRGGAEREQGHHPLGGRANQAQAGRGDHAERALAPTEEPGQVIAGVVLDQTAQVRDDLPGPEHRRGPEKLGPGVAVAQHTDPAGIGRDRPTQGGAPSAGDVDPVGPAGRRGGVLEVRQHDTRADSHLPRGRIELEHGEPPKAAHHLAVERHGPARKAGVASLQRQGHAVAPAQLDQCLDLLGRAGSHDGRRRPREPARPIARVASHHVGVQEELALPNHLFDVAEERRIDRTHPTMVARHSDMHEVTQFRPALRSA